MSKVKSITPNPPADFIPESSNTKALQPFRYWCQKVLPLVYDDSLSYYEMLCKVVDYLNKTMEDVTNLHAAYVQLQNYVNNYFSTLDVQEEINKKLDEMASTGQLNQLFNKYIPYITVEQYGAVGDGVTDDSQAFIDAINAELPIFLSKEKTYFCDNLQLKKIKKRIVIYGNYSTIKTTNGIWLQTDDPEYVETYESNVYNCYLDNLFIVGNDINTGITISGKKWYVNNVEVKHFLTAYNFYGDCIESSFNNLRYEFCRTGFVLNTQDAMFNQLFGRFAEVALVVNGAGNQINGIHCWRRETDYPTTNVFAQINTTVYMDDVEVDNYSKGFITDDYLNIGHLYIISKIDTVILECENYANSFRVWIGELLTNTVGKVTFSKEKSFAKVDSYNGGFIHNLPMPLIYSNNGINYYLYGNIIYVIGSMVQPKNTNTVLTFPSNEHLVPDYEQFKNWICILGTSGVDLDIITGVTHGIYTQNAIKTLDTHENDRTIHIYCSYIRNSAD